MAGKMSIPSSSTAPTTCQKRWYTAQELQDYMFADVSEVWCDLSDDPSSNMNAPDVSVGLCPAPCFGEYHTLKKL